MKKSSIILTSAVFCFCLALQIYAGDNSNARFDKIKALAGEWKGKAHDGKNITVTYEVTAGGSAVLERQMAEDHPEMLTLYHMDGDKLMMTHYCIAQNQPRMRAVKSDDSGIDFDFVDATNMAKETDGHMHKLKLSFKGENALGHAWTWQQDGAENVVTFDLKRTAMSMK